MNTFIKFKENYIGRGLTLAQILIVCKIEQFTDKGKSCYMTDEAFAQLTQQSVRQTQRVISELEKMHVITRNTQLKKDNGQASRIRTLTVNDVTKWQTQGNDTDDATLSEGNDVDDVTLTKGNDICDTKVTTSVTEGNDIGDVKGNDMDGGILYNPCLLDKEKDNFNNTPSFAPRQTDRKDKTQNGYNDDGMWELTDQANNNEPVLIVNNNDTIWGNDDNDDDNPFSYSADAEAVESLKILQRMSSKRRDIVDLTQKELKSLVDDFAAGKRYKDIREDYWLASEVTIHTIRTAEDLLKRMPSA